MSDLLKVLDWKRLELMCAGYFEELGFRAETVRGGPDGGVDVHFYTKGSRHPAIIVQCKAWRSGSVGWVAMIAISSLCYLLPRQEAAQVISAVVAKAS